MARDVAFDRDDPVHIEAARATPMGWCWYAMHGRYDLAPHLDVMNREIMDCILKPDGRLLLEMPPRHGKSRLAAVGTAGWVLGHYPDACVAVASGSLSLARRHGRQTRNEFREHASRVFGLAVDPKRDAVTDWGVIDAHTGKRFAGGYRAYGVGTQFTGEGADVLILDDLVPDAEAADSDTIRENTWDWVESVAWTRLEPGASVIAIMTRWHEDDPHGRFRERFKSEGWRIVRMPALSEGDDDPLGRPEGAALWPERHNQARLERTKANLSPRWWNAMWQQRPTALEGGVWKSAWWHEPDRTFRVIDSPAGRSIRTYDHYQAPLSECIRFVVVDIATTEKASADYTVIGMFALTPEKPRRLLMLDMDRRRMEGPDINPSVERMLRKWGASIAYYEEVGTQTMVMQFARRAGIPAKSIGRNVNSDVRIAGDKVAVAHEASPLASNGRLLWPADEAWWADVEHELLTFPNATHDDAADVVAWACHVALRVGHGSVLASLGRAAPRERIASWRRPRALGGVLDEMGPADPGDVIPNR